MFLVLNGSFEYNTHNICFGLEIRKIIFNYTHLSGGLLDRIQLFEAYGWGHSVLQVPFLVMSSCVINFIFL